MTPYQGKCKNRLNRCRHACETHTLLRHTIEIAKAVLTDAETHLKRMHSDAIPIETQKPFKRRRHAYETHAL